MFMGLVLLTALGLGASAQEPAFTRAPRAEVASRLRAAARLGTNYVPGRVLVKFRAGLPTQAQTSAITPLHWKLATRRGCRNRTRC